MRPPILRIATSSGERGEGFEDLLDVFLFGAGEFWVRAGSMIGWGSVAR